MPELPPAIAAGHASCGQSCAPARSGSARPAARRATRAGEQPPACGAAARPGDEQPDEQAPPAGSTTSVLFSNPTPSASADRERTSGSSPVRSTRDEHELHHGPDQQVEGGGANRCPAPSTIAATAVATAASSCARRGHRRARGRRGDQRRRRGQRARRGAQHAPAIPAPTASTTRASSGTSGGWSTYPQARCRRPPGSTTRRGGSRTGSPTTSARRRRAGRPRRRGARRRARPWRPATALRPGRALQGRSCPASPPPARTSSPR